MARWLGVPGINQEKSNFFWNLFAEYEEEDADGEGTVGGGG
jgi:hypothetical protein